MYGSDRGVTNARARCGRALSAVLLLSVSACASGPGGSSGGVCGSGSQYWHSDGVMTVVEGAAVGAAIGGLAGALAGKNVQTAAIGAGIGALHGGGVGCAVSANKAQYATTEDTYDATLANMQRLNQQLGAKSANLAEEQASLDRDIAALSGQQQSAMARHAQAQQRLATASNQTAEGRKLVAAAREDLKKEEALVAEAEKTYGANSEQAARLREQRNQTLTVVTNLNSQVQSLAASTNQLGSI